MYIGGKTILHFDNEEKDTLQIPFFLKSKGLKVIYASKESTVIDIIKSGDTVIDLILMNIYLGTETNVAELGRKILNIKDIPIMFISSHSAPEFFEKTESVISYGYFEMGSSHSILIAMIKNALKLFDINTNLKKQLKKQGHSDNISQNILKEITDGFGSDNEISMADRISHEYRIYEKGHTKQNITGLRAIDIAEKPVREFHHETDYSRTQDNKLTYKILTDHSGWGITTESPDNLSIFANAFNNSGIGMTILDAEFKYLCVNPSFCRMTGYSEKELLGKSPIDISHPDDIEKSYDNIEKMFRKADEPQLIEKRYLKKNGEVLWALVNNSVIWNSDGSLSYFISYIQEITERKNGEHKLEILADKLKESNAEKEKYISIIAHDLRGPVSSFVGLTSEILKNQEILSKMEMKELINAMHQSAAHILSILLNLLDWSSLKRENSKMNNETVYLMEAVVKTAELFTEMIKDKSIFLILNIEQDAILSTNRKVLETVLRNLISNAVKFSKVGGSIKIISEINGNIIKLYVKDNGLGMDEEIIKMINSGYSVKSHQGTKKERGTGLGLALCHELLESYDGILNAASKLGEGSTISFTLPCSEIKYI